LLDGVRSLEGARMQSFIGVSGRGFKIYRWIMSQCLIFCYLSAFVVIRIDKIDTRTIFAGILRIADSLVLD